MPDTPIGTNSPDYTLVTADLGADIYCKVTATNASGAANAYSNTVGPVTAVTVASTWDPAHKTAGLALSGGNLIATISEHNDFALQQVRGTASKSTGKRYFEITITTTASLTASEIILYAGIIDGSAFANQIPGIENSIGFSWGYQPNGSGGAQTGGQSLTPDPAISFTGGDVVGFACDLDANTLTGVYKNGVLIPMSVAVDYPLNWGGTALDDVFPMATMQWQSVGPASMTLNTAGPFALATLPSGYVAWET